MSNWRILIVEDDPVVAFVYRSVIERTARFEVVGTVESGLQARAEIGRTDPDLLLLDLTLRGTHGMQLLRELRGGGSKVEAIAVTASSEAATVHAMLQLGVVDYLVKPFSPERLQQALSLFTKRMAALSLGVLDQSRVDALASSGRARRWLPKGLAEDTLRQVRDALAQSSGPFSADMISARTGIATVTARRYLEYLAATQQATLETVSAGPGRPRKVYRLARIEGLREPHRERPGSAERIS